MVLEYQLDSVILKARAFSAFFSGPFTFDEGKTWKYPRLFIADSENDETHCRLNNQFRDEKSSFFHGKTFITWQGHLRAFNQWRCHSVTWHFAHILSVLSYYLLFYKIFVLHIFYRSTKRNVLPWLRVKTANNVVITTYKSILKEFFSDWLVRASTENLFTRVTTSWKASSTFPAYRYEFFILWARVW